MLLRTLASLCSLTFAVPAFGWGHLDFVGGDWGKSTLTYALVNRKAISYCVKSDVPKSFPPKNLSEQVAQALLLWVHASGKYKNAKIKEVSCYANPDLVAQVGPESDFTEMSGYHVPQIENGRFYSLVKLNSEYTYTEDKRRYRVVDFASMIPVSIPPQKVMEEVSERKPMSVGDFSGKYRVHYQRVYLSSYKMLLHEIGHAFGLCDTEDSLSKYCDVKFRTKVHQPAIMKNADFFYLTEDDKAGLAALIKRFESAR